MEAENHYDTLGLRPDASHREVLHAFSRLAERYRRQMSDPAARQRFQEVKAAYQTLTDYGSRLSYNIERGLPDPPRHGKHEEKPGFVEEMASLIPSRWYIFAFFVVGFVYMVVASVFDYHGPMPGFP
jgi:curved DNA-binding protein CbpA